MELGSYELAPRRLQENKLEALVGSLTKRVKILESENNNLRKRLSDLLKVFPGKQVPTYDSPSSMSLEDDNLTGVGWLCRSCRAGQTAEKNERMCNSAYNAEIDTYQAPDCLSKADMIESFSMDNNFLKKHSFIASLGSPETEIPFSSDNPLPKNLDQLLSEVFIKKKEGSIKQSADEDLAVNPVEGSCLRASAVSQLKKREKSRGKCFRDMSDYAKWHVALKIMYLGERYHGFASQACSGKTIEAELFAALEKTKLLLGERSKANYSRCGRTDKGVSATGQVIALFLRSGQKVQTHVARCSRGDHSASTYDSFGCVEIGNEVSTSSSTHESSRDMVHHEPRFFIEGQEFRGDRVAAVKESRVNEARLTDDKSVDYVGILNRALPIDIRVLGWCPVPIGFHARFSCLFREYKYFFINSDLDVDAMKKASQSFLGDHDFRNFCKMDAENVHNYRRSIISFDIFPVNSGFTKTNLWVMQVKGSAFLWHQVRCMAAVLLMVGHGHESPSIVQELLDLSITPKKPQYTMASELPLVLHACAFDNLTFQCPPTAANQVRFHLERLMSQVFIKASIYQDGLSQLPSVHSIPKSITQATHIPLKLRGTEPSYEERRWSKAKTDLQEEILEN